MVGQTISHYEITEKLGEGGMGVVYKAEDTRLKRTVALKFLAARAVGEGEHRARFQREAQAAAALNHPNVCTIHEVDDCDGHLFIAMEFVEGDTVSEKVQAGPVKLDEAIDIAIQSARGLAAAHEREIVHRDVKGANIMVVPEKTGRARQVKLMDFGLAYLTYANTNLTKEGTTLGTTSYMSPEQASGEKVDQRADIWALGVVLYEMVAGRLPFYGEYEQAVLYSIMHEAPEPLTAVRTGVPKELERIVEKALAKTPAQRYQHVADLLVDLEALEREQGSERSAVHAVPAEPKKSAPGMLYAAAVVAVVAVAAVAYLTLGPGDPKPSEPLRARALTSYPGSEFSPAVSPDGKRIAFSWQREGEDAADIYTLELGATEPAQLTNTPDHETSAAWSPDGASIAFVRTTLGGGGVLWGGRSALAVMPAVGGPARVINGVRPAILIESVQPSLRVAWAPSGRALIVGHQEQPDSPFHLVRVSLDTGEIETLTTGGPEGSRTYDPALSPDGRTLAFVGRSGTSGLFTAAIASAGTIASEPQPAGRDLEGWEWCPAWTANGEELVFAASGNVLQRGLWRVTPSRPDPPRPLESLGPNAGCASVFPDGRRLVFTQRSVDFNIWRVEISPNGKATDAGRRFLSSTLYDASPHYSPDGRHIVFESDRGGTKGIWVANADGSNARAVFMEEARPAGAPAWSPDGRRIVFDAMTEGQSEIYVVNTAGGPPLRLTHDPGISIVGTWSRDGAWVYFWAQDRNIWKVSGGGGEPEQVTHIAGVERYAIESPDGKWLYFSHQDEAVQRLMRMPIGGGEPEPVASDVPGWSFAVTERGVYFIRRDTRGEDSAYSIFFSDPSTGEESVVAELPAGTRPFVALSVSPDGRTLLYDRIDQAGADLMLVENFR